MLNYIYALILGVVEGITEFLPISSTAHLIITAHILQIPQDKWWTFFEIFIQVGAISAVVVSFFKRLTSMRTLALLFASFVPTAIVGMVLYKIIKNVFFQTTWIIAVALIVFGAYFIFLERKQMKNSKNNKTLANMTIRHAVIIGLAQSVAVIPGVSRAGAVIVAALLLGYKRTDAALYSFLLALPTIIAAAGFDMLKTDFSIVSSSPLVLALGFVSAFIVAYIVVKWLVSYLQNNTLEVFGWYRIVVGVLIALMLFFRIL